MREIIFLTEDILDESKKYKRLAKAVAANPALFQRLSAEDQRRVQSQVWGNRVVPKTVAELDAVDQVALDDTDPWMSTSVKEKAAEMGDKLDAKLKKQIAYGGSIKKGESNIYVDAPSARLETQARAKKIANIMNSKGGNASQRLYDHASDYRNRDDDYRELEYEASVAKRAAKNRGETIIGRGYHDEKSGSIVVDGKQYKNKK